VSTPATSEQERLSGELAELEPATASDRRRLLVIINPYAATVSDRLRNLVVHALRARYDVDAVDTDAPGHAVELCREAALEGYDVVVAFGGDGTVNEAANGLLGSSTPLCVLPGGSTNVFARMIGIPGEIVDATEHLLGIADDWRPRTVDVGIVNGRCFTFASGLGLDASVVRRVDARPDLKVRFGPYYFTWVAISTFARRYLLRATRMRVRAGSHELDGVTAIVQNGSPFTYFQDRPVEIADGATLNSGTLSCAVLRRARALDMPTLAWRALSARAHVERHRQISVVADLEELTVSSLDGGSLPLQVDGDYVGDVASASYSIRPAALAIIS
jgi:diacylglycerol kinase family enzyme